MQGRRVLVTGATGGAAPAFLDALAAAGASLVLTGIGADRLRDLEQQYGAVGFEANLSSEEAVQELLAATGPVDGIVHLMGGFAMGKVADAAPTTLDLMLDLNVRSLWFLARGYLPCLRERRGFLVGVGAGPGLNLGAAEMGAYAAGKAGLLALLRSIGQEEPAVHALALIPLGTLDTPGNRATMPEVDPATWIDPRCMADAVVLAVKSSARGRIEELRIHPPA